MVIVQFTIACHFYTTKNPTKIVNMKVNLNIYNLLGQSLIFEEVELEKGNAQVELSRSTFAAGTYIYSVILNDGSKLIGRFVVQ